MRPEACWNSEQRFADIVVLLGVVCLVLATWPGLSHSVGMPLWTSCFSTVATMFLALAALTRHPYWAARIRLLTGTWIIAAPHLLGFADLTSAPRTYLTIGALIAAMSVPGLVRRRPRRDELLFDSSLRDPGCAEGTRSLRV